MTIIKLKRVYEKPSIDDGYRVLVDRIWPRGISKERAALDEWNRDLAPSGKLRKWFRHDPEKWQEFSLQYMQELTTNAKGEEFLDRLEDYEKITLIYTAKDTEHCHPLVLREYLESLLKSRDKI